MRGKITAPSIVAILSMILFTSSFSAASADPQSDFDNCPPPTGVFVRMTVHTDEGPESKTFPAKSYSTSKTTEGGTGSISKLPDKHSQQLSNSVGNQVDIVIVDCGLTEEGSSYRYVTTLTGTIDSFSQSGGPPVETITFSFSESEVEYTENP